MNKEIKSIKAQRKRLLDYQFSLYRRHCMNCNLHPKGMRKDGANPICKFCPSGKRLRGIGEDLNQLLLRERQIKQRK